MIKGVFFDLGGTLYSYSSMREALGIILRNVAERKQLESSLETLGQTFQEATKQVDNHYAEVPFYLFKDYMKATYKAFCESLDTDIHPDDYDWFVQQQMEHLLESMPLKDDCHHVLDTLNGNGLYLSIVSNIDDDMLDRLLEKGNLEHRFHHITSSETAESCKPDPRFFSIALEKSGLNPEEVLFVGDSIEQDILGANAAGMNTALIADVSDVAPMHIGREVVEPTYKINSLSELLGIIDSHNSRF